MIIYTSCTRNKRKGRMVERNGRIGTRRKIQTDYRAADSTQSKRNESFENDPKS